MRSTRALWAQLSAKPSSVLPGCTTLVLPATATRPATLTVTLSNLYLRHASEHPLHLHAASQQKLVKASDIPSDSQVVGVRYSHPNPISSTVDSLPATIGDQDRQFAADVEGLYLELEWDKPLLVSPVPTARGTRPRAPVTDVPSIVGGNVTLHPVAWLVRHANALPASPPLPMPTPWKAATLPATLYSQNYNTYMGGHPTNSPVMHDYLTSLLKNGIAFLTKVPTAKKVGEHTMLAKVVGKMGKIRRTWYGDLWDVRAEEGSKNIAYTDLELGLHMDLVHFESPPRYQYLHSLLNSGITGGSSYFVDTFHVCDMLKRHHAKHFKTLCEEDVEFLYKNGDKWTKWRRKTIELDDQGRVWAVNYSPPFQGDLVLSRRKSPSKRKTGSRIPKTDEPETPIPLADSLTTLSDIPTLSSVAGQAYLLRLSKLHQALGMFAQICSLKKHQHWQMLNEGDCVVFDNRRILHAREGFKFDESVSSPLAEMDMVAPIAKVVKGATESRETGATTAVSDPGTLDTSVEAAAVAPETPANNSGAVSTPVTVAALVSAERGRWLKGAYQDGDELWSKWRIGEVLRLGTVQRAHEAEARHLLAKRKAALSVTIVIEPIENSEEEAAKISVEVVAVDAAETGMPLAETGRVEAESVEAEAEEEVAAILEVLEVVQEAK